MQLNLSTLVGLYFAFTGAAAIPIEDVSAVNPNAYRFLLFQQPGSAGGLPLNVTGTRKSPEACSPQPEFNFALVLVEADAGGHCNITFYEADNGKRCIGTVAEDPGKIQTGECFTFKSAPGTFGVTCRCWSCLSMSTSISV